MATTKLPVPTPADAPSEEARAGLLDYLTTVDHKKIGILYIYTAFGVFFAGGILAMLVRAELAEPGLQYMGQHTYNQVFTMHGTLMIFLFAAQVTTGLANYFIPLHLGAADVAFPRMNATSYWLYLFGSLIVLSSFFVAGGSAAVGWTAYPPLSDARYMQGTGMDLWIIGLLVVGLSGILGSINLLTTIFRLRAPGMTMFRIPMFVWTVLVNQLLILLAFPALTAALAMLFLDRKFGAGFFNPDQGGTPVLYLHIFGSSATPRSTSSSCPCSASSARSPRSSPASRCSATGPWCLPPSSSPATPSLSGPTTCSPPARSTCTGSRSCRSSSPCPRHQGVQLAGHHVARLDLADHRDAHGRGVPGRLCHRRDHWGVSGLGTDRLPGQRHLPTSSPTSTTSWSERYCSACSPASITGSPR
jgi:cytochrome c oxidase subunit 1